MYLYFCSMFLDNFMDYVVVNPFQLYRGGLLYLSLVKEIIVIVERHESTTITISLSTIMLYRVYLAMSWNRSRNLLVIGTDRRVHISLYVVLSLSPSLSLSLSLSLDWSIDQPIVRQTIQWPKLKRTMNKHKKCLKIPEECSETVNWRTTDNTMATRYQRSNQKREMKKERQHNGHKIPEE
jgi:hypothetical protein